MFLVQSSNDRASTSLMYFIFFLLAREDDEDDDAADESVVNSDNEDDDISIDEETGVINKKTKQVVSKKTTSKYVEELPKAKLDIPVSFEKNESDYESDEDEEEVDSFFGDGEDNMAIEEGAGSTVQAKPTFIRSVHQLASCMKNNENLFNDLGCDAQVVMQSLSTFVGSMTDYLGTEGNDMKALSK